MPLFISIIAVSAALTYAGIAWFRAQSLKHGWLDVPNQRSSHKTPTPRGAGVVIVAVCLAGYLVSSWVTGSRVSWAYLAGALVIAIVSWLDDLYSIDLVWRLIIHFLVACLLVAIEGHWTAISFGNGTSITLGSTGGFVTVLWIVWVINAYNFMDGIDGLAGIQGLVASAAWAVIAIKQQNGNFLFLTIVFASLAGFIVHNWSPAKIFVGDVGSAFLGYTFAAAPWLLNNESQIAIESYPLASVLILWPFILDSVFSRIRRLKYGLAIWRPNREHLYQRMVTSGLSHGTVATIYGIFAVITSSAALFLTSGRTDASFFLVLGCIAVLSLFFLFVVSNVERRAAHNNPPHVA